MARTRKAMIAKVGGASFNELHEEALALNVLLGVRAKLEKAAAPEVEVVEEVEKHLNRYAPKNPRKPKAEAKRPGWSAVAKKAWVTRRANLAVAA